MSRYLSVGYNRDVIKPFSLNLFFLVFYSVAFGPSLTMASDETSCSTVRLDKNGGPFEKLPVYDQNRNAKDDTNLCYATTASLLIDASRSLREEVPPFTAPLSISLNYKVHQSKLPLNLQDPTNPSDSSMLAFSMVGGGYIDTAIEANRDEVVCDQRFLQKFDDAMGSEQRSKSEVGSAQDSTTENFLRNVLDQTEKYRRESQFIERVASRTAALNDFFKCRTDSSFSNISDILEAAKAAHLAENPLEKAATFVAKLCKKSSFKVRTPRSQKLDGVSGDYLKENMDLVKKLSDPTLSSEQRSQLVKDFQEKFDPKKKIAKLDKQINSLLTADIPTPVGIGYCHDSLFSKEEVNCAPTHASVIIGRRFNHENKTCEFLIRDSYGPSCDNAEGKSRYAWPCENGNVWIDSNKLLRSASSITWIPAK